MMESLASSNNLFILWPSPFFDLGGNSSPLAKRASPLPPPELS